MKNDILKTLNTVFGYSSFKPEQERIIISVLEGRDVFAAMPTGGGKSLCYQLPSLLLPGITVVISPLIALMKDQVDSAGENGIRAGFINSSLSREESSGVYEMLAAGRLKLLYIAPERFSSDGFADLLKSYDVSHFAVDEAHCVSEWGHDFRPDYLSLSLLKKVFPGVPVSAFTATATKKVQEDIIARLGLDNPLRIRSSFNRKELYYRITRKTDVNRQVLDFILQNPGKSGIVYRNTRRDVETTSAFLKEKGIKALPYHAGLLDSERKNNQELFRTDEADVIVATIAFGMGIDKSNIRFVIHGDLPKSIESYYQETGRAGRDGEKSDCLLLYSRGDTGKIHFHIRNISDETEKERALKNLYRMTGYAETGACRRKQLLSYFDEDFPGDCGMCDSCNDEIERVDAAVDARKILSAVKRSGERFGSNYIVDIVKGANTERIRKNRHDLLPTYGVGKGESRDHWHAVLDELIGQGCVLRDDENYSILKILERGLEILFGDDQFFIAKRYHIKKTASEEDTGEGDEELLDLLKKLRRSIAGTKALPPYMIFSDKTLREMSLKKPATLDEFSEINGVGQIKLDSYGREFVRCITEYTGG